MLRGCIECERVMFSVPVERGYQEKAYNIRRR